ncbi:MAG: MarR family transcriptional regulator [Pseudomonadota bacterium]
MSLSTEQLEEQVRKLSELNDFLTYRISKMGRLLEAEATLRLKGTGINLTTYRIMLVISIFEEITVSDLARLLVIDRAQVSRLASDMTRKRLLTSKPERSNKLKKLLMLTETGKVLCSELKTRFEGRTDLIAQHATEEELAMLVPLLDRINTSLAERVEGA